MICNQIRRSPARIERTRSSNSRKKSSPNARPFSSWFVVGRETFHRQHFKKAGCANAKARRSARVDTDNRRRRTRRANRRRRCRFCRLRQYVQIWHILLRLLTRLRQKYCADVSLSPCGWTPNSSTVAFCVNQIVSSLTTAFTDKSSSAER